MFMNQEYSNLSRMETNILSNELRDLERRSKNKDRSLYVKTGNVFFHLSKEDKEKFLNVQHTSAKY